MKIKLFRSFIGFATALALLASSAAAGDADAPEGMANYRIRKVNVCFEHDVQLLDWVVVGDNSSVVFALDTEKPLRTTAPDIVTFRSFTLDSNGKVGTSSDLLIPDGGRVKQAAAFWFAEQAPETAHGLLLIAYHPESQGDERNVGRFAVASFDASGRLTSDFETLLELNAPEEMFYGNLWLSAEVRGDVVGVFAGADGYENSDDLYGRRAGEAYFMEVSSTGALREPGVADVELPRDGDYRLFQPYKPAWNGESWMVPGVVTLLKRKVRPLYKDYVGQIGYQVQVLRVTPSQAGDSFAMAMHKIASERTKIHWPTYVSLVFLPRVSVAASPTQRGEQLYLLYTHAKRAKGQLVSNLSKRYTHFYHLISADGRSIGERRKFKAAPWYRPYWGTPDRVSEETSSFFSNYAVLTYCGRVLLAHSRSGYYRELYGSNTWQELQLDYYSFDPGSGQVDRLAGANYTGKICTGGPLLRAFFGPVQRSLSLLRLEPNDVSYRFYFSKLPVY